MALQKKNMIKAIFLQMVFSLNTLAGFACSLGVEMGYNSKHHKHDKHFNEGHKHEAGHGQGQGHSQKYSGPVFSNPNKDCCSNQVNSFTKLDKSVVHNNLLLKVPIFYISSVSKFSIEGKDEPGITVNSRFQFVRRSCSLDDTDIRISIQSFQI